MMDYAGRAAPLTAACDTPEWLRRISTKAFSEFHAAAVPLFTIVLPSANDFHFPFALLSQS
jgi:hypothetical protein